MRIADFTLTILASLPWISVADMKEDIVVLDVDIPSKSFSSIVSGAILASGDWVARSSQVSFVARSSTESKGITFDPAKPGKLNFQTEDEIVSTIDAATAEGLHFLAGFCEAASLYVVRTSTNKFSLYSWKSGEATPSLISPSSTNFYELQDSSPWSEIVLDMFSRSCAVSTSSGKVLQSFDPVDGKDFWFWETIDLTDVFLQGLNLDKMSHPFSFQQGVFGHRVAAGIVDGKAVYSQMNMGSGWSPMASLPFVEGIPLQAGVKYHPNERYFVVFVSVKETAGSGISFSTVFLVLPEVSNKNPSWSSLEPVFHSSRVVRGLVFHDQPISSIEKGFKEIPANGILYTRADIKSEISTGVYSAKLIPEILTVFERELRLSFTHDPTLLKSEGIFPDFGFSYIPTKRYWDVQCSASNCLATVASSTGRANVWHNSKDTEFSWRQISPIDVPWTIRGVHISADQEPQITWLVSIVHEKGISIFTGSPKNGFALSGTIDIDNSAPARECATWIINSSKFVIACNRMDGSLVSFLATAKGTTLEHSLVSSVTASSFSALSLFRSYGEGKNYVFYVDSSAAVNRYSMVPINESGTLGTTPATLFSDISKEDQTSLLACFVNLNSCMYVPSDDRTTGLVNMKRADLPNDTKEYLLRTGRDVVQSTVFRLSEDKAMVTMRESLLPELDPLGKRESFERVIVDLRLGSWKPITLQSNAMLDQCRIVALDESSKSAEVLYWDICFEESSNINARLYKVNATTGEDITLQGADSNNFSNDVASNSSKNAFVSGSVGWLIGVVCTLSVIGGYRLIKKRRSRGGPVVVRENEMHCSV